MTLNRKRLGFEHCILDVEASAQNVTVWPFLRTAKSATELNGETLTIGMKCENGLRTSERDDQSRCTVYNNTLVAVNKCCLASNDVHRLVTKPRPPIAMMSVKFYRALESVSMALALSTALTIYPCQIRVQSVCSLSVCLSVARSHDHY